MSKHYFASIIILLLTLHASRAQEELKRYYAASYDAASQTITFYDAEDTVFTPIGSVNAGFTEDSPFRLVSISRVALSPDGQHAALIGQDTTINARLPVYQLRIYNLTTQQLTTEQPIPLPSVSMLPSWSPDGQFLLVKPTDAYFDPPPIPENLLYSLRNDDISYPVDTFSQLDTLFWTPDNVLLYDNPIDPRQESLMTFLPADMALTDSMSLEAPININLDNQSICQFAWSPYNSRWYFSIGCAGDGSGIEQIYSFSNASDLRLEVSLKDYVEDYPRAAQVNDVQVTSNGVYVLTPWPSRVIHIGFDGTIMPLPQGNEVDAGSLRISPNGQWVALYGRELGLVINMLVTGERVVNSTVSGRICHMRWLDDTLLIFSTFDSWQCVFDNFVLPTGIHVWDITSNTFTLPLGETSWLLPMPYAD
jgi:hypothetical protein